MKATVIKVMLLALGILISLTVWAAELAMDDTLPAFELQDQHEQTMRLTEDTRILLFSRGMQASETINQALTSLSSEKLPQDLLYVADISAMPSLIAKFVALPQMRDLPFRIALDSEGELTRDWPGDAKRATVIKLERLTVISMTQVGSSEALLEAIK
ncbi:hypothetical protein LZP69_12150 [Shewanella sp. AS1]|uniref:hypothetical protein n=1 Tax=Shewanella sp. AS1 TaxID=2907626 RepID=UPI001F34E940|nr:hypothetical protein [Shewanella sp. AS1]MCE9679915.1 hypothetical protein [Shewanella sp. AS1]